MKSNKKIALIGLFCAIAYIFTLLGGLLPISVAGFLKYDPKDIIVAIAGFILGPASALAISVLTALMELITGISTTGFYGLLMNIISTASFACISSYIYKRDKTLRGAIIGLVAATIITTGLMLLWNYFITPFYMSVPREAVLRMLPTAFLPFNLIKYGINACLALLIYKPVVTAMRKSHILETTAPAKSRPKLWIILITSFVLISLIFCLLILAKVI
ncbi:MAG: ECF transporter S component [Clostridia bacterium]|nr:ECF transporter S component [Clostridia bacterium]